MSVNNDFTKIVFAIKSLVTVMHEMHKTMKETNKILKEINQYAEATYRKN